MTTVSPYCGQVLTAVQARAEVVEHVQLARDTWRLRIAAPEITAQVTPGQFFMIREPDIYAPLLGRPFALYDTWLDADGRLAGIDVVYLVVGRMTTRMSTWQTGDVVELWGPLGNGFPVPPDREGRLLMVAGGIGNTPFLAVAREALGQRSYGLAGGREVSVRKPGGVTFCYGARSEEYLAGVPDFEALEVELRLATDDGSHGHKGFVTDLVKQELAQGDVAAVYCCGPEPMMHAVARLAAQFKVPCWLSLETPMACGFGACFSCVTRVKQPEGDWDYRRTCIEGPIFPAEVLEF